MKRSSGTRGLKPQIFLKRTFSKTAVNSAPLWNVLPSFIANLRAANSESKRFSISITAFSQELFTIKFVAKVIFASVTAIAVSSIIFAWSLPVRMFPIALQSDCLSIPSIVVANGSRHVIAAIPAVIARII
uniref:Uncharacterized protein n=1 Tax=Meloidogyne incognita TaxID=6306 RepID=A0A914MSJ0_MELIC